MNQQKSLLIDNAAVERRCKDELRRIKKIAQDKGITNQCIADASGLQRSAVNRMINGRSLPNFRNYVKLVQTIDLLPAKNKISYE